jgi:hypothetical protein
VLRVIWLACAILLGLAGCADDSDTVASISGPSAERASQLDGAEALVSCLIDNGLPAQLNDVADGQASIGWEPRHTVLQVVAGGGVEEFGEISGEQRIAFGADGNERSRLIVDEVDQSDVFRACIELSGYLSPEPHSDTARWEELRRLEVANATNEWAACARDHGFPRLEDVPPDSVRGIDGREPFVALPGTITKPELQTLLEDCPVFDPDRVSVDQSGFEDILTEEAMPAVIIEFPQFDDNIDASDAETAWFIELSTMLEQSRRDFYLSHGIDLTAG